MKRRLSASIDEDVLAAAESAVRDGVAPSVSALVEKALKLQVERSQRLAATDALLADLDREDPMQSDEAERLMREWRAEADAAAAADARAA